MTGNQAADTPGGTVTFFLCSQVPATGSCSSGGTNIGTGTLSGSGATANVSGSTHCESTSLTINN